MELQLESLNQQCTEHLAQAGIFHGIPGVAQIVVGRRHRIRRLRDDIVVGLFHPRLAPGDLPEAEMKCNLNEDLEGDPVDLDPAAGSDCDTREMICVRSGFDGGDFEFKGSGLCLSDGDDWGCLSRKENWKHDARDAGRAHASIIGKGKSKGNRGYAFGLVGALFQWLAGKVVKRIPEQGEADNTDPCVIQERVRHVK